MNVKHTPGPWRLVDDAQGPCMVMHPTKRGVCIASLTDTHKPVNHFVEIEAVGAPERTANARLIAASPELLASLERLVRWYDNEHLQAETLFGDPTEAFAQARAALAKLEGK